MDAILNILYDALRPDMASPEEQAVLKREEDFLDEMERRLGPDDFTRFWDAVAEIGHCRAASDFQLGFWLGANLVLTAETGPFPQNQR